MSQRKENMEPLIKWGNNLRKSCHFSTPAWSCCEWGVWYPGGGFPVLWACLSAPLLAEFPRFAWWHAGSLAEDVQVRNLLWKRGSNFNFHVCFFGLKRNISIKVYRECNEPFYRFNFSTRISWNVTIVVDDRIWGFVTALHWCNWFLDAWRVWTPQLCIAWKSGQTWMCTTVYVTLLADIYADLQHEWGSKKKHTVPSMILWC